jgi:hypothetical protein
MWSVITIWMGLNALLGGLLLARPEGRSVLRVESRRGGASRLVA